MTRTLLLVGTRKGAFIVDGGSGPRDWSVSDPMCEGWPIHDLQWDPTTGSIYAGGGSPWYGPAVFRSDDCGGIERLGGTVPDVDGQASNPSVFGGSIPAVR